MIDLKLLISIGKQIQKARRLNLYLTTVFGRLLLVVLVGDFYQFTSVLGKAHWDYLIREEEIYGKSL